MTEILSHEEDTATSRRVDFDPGYDFLQQVPFESLYRNLVRHACSTVRLAFGPGYGDKAVSAVLGSLPKYDEPDLENIEEFDRRIREADLSILDDLEIVRFDWEEMAADFVCLYAFAWHGQGPRPDVDESRQLIVDAVSHFRRLVDDPGVKAIVSTDFDWFVDTLAAAEARWATDNGLPVTPDTLSALAGVKSKTLANLMASNQLVTDADGRISAVVALKYLNRRKGFIASSWQTSPPSAAASASADNPPLPAQVFVPVDSDGNPFLPSTARPGRDGRPRYIIGDKSSPIYVEDYWEALDRLALMPVPKWRRPPASGAGSWGLVSGQEGWRRFPRSDLERMLESISIGLPLNPA